MSSRILVTGPESSGTTLLSRIFEVAGADKVYHRSATYAGDYPAMRPLANHECDAVIVIFRNPVVTMWSQNWAADPYRKLQQGYHEIFRALADIDTPIYVVSYEQIIWRPQSLQPLLHNLGLDPDATYEVEIRDENAKYFAGKRAKKGEPVVPAQPTALGYALGPGVVCPYPEES